MNKKDNRLFQKTYIRLTLSIVIILTGYIILLGYFIDSRTDQIYKIRKAELRRSVYTAYNSISSYVEKFNQNKISHNTAMKKITERIREMTYEDEEGKNYFFMSSYEGIMLVQPFERSKEGSSQINLIDTRGLYIIRELIKTARSPEGEGFVLYHYYHPSLKKEIQKLSFVMGINGLNCYIGLGLYTHDLEVENSDFFVKSIILTLILFSAILTITFVFMKPFLNSNKILLNYFRLISESPETMQVLPENRYSSDSDAGLIITGFRKMIEKLDNSINMIKKSEEEFRSFFENSMDANLLISEEGNFHKVNNAALDIFGYTADEFFLLNFTELIKENSEKIKILNQIKEENFIKYYETSMIKKGGQKLDVYLTVFPQSPGSTKTLYHVIIKDISLQIHLQNQLIHSQKMETIGILTGGIAHNFNNYLGGIMGAVSILRRLLHSAEGVNSAKIQKYMDILNDSTTSAARMVDNIQSLSKKQEFNFSVIDLSEIITKVLNICESTLDKSIEIKFANSSNNSIIYGDQQIEQVIFNLITNSAHAMTFMRKEASHWGGTLTISLSKFYADQVFCLEHAEAHEQYYSVISVEDTGVGIEKKDLPFVFDPFFTTKDKSSGTGLGLSTTYRVVEEHGGFITLHSDLNQGTSITLYLPSYTETIKIEEDSHPDVKDKFTGHVLIIDDDESILETGEEMMKYMGFETQKARSGDKGIALLEKSGTSINLIILDLAMPLKSGLETYTDIRRINREVKVILVSGYREDRRIKQMLESGVCGFIQKPFSFSDVYKTLIKNGFKVKE